MSAALRGDTRPGPRQRQVQWLERRWREATGRNHIVACRSATAAMRLAVHGLGLGPGDEFICPADAFPTAWIIAAISGATPVLVDIDPGTLQVDPAGVEAAITPRTRLLIAVDRYGTTPDYRSLDALSHRRDLPILEDGSQAYGALFDGRPVGSLGTASFFILGAGRTDSPPSGCVLAVDGEAAESARRLALMDDGLLPAGAGPTTAALLVNGLMTELDAAAANAGLAASDEELAARAANGSHLARRLAEIPGLDVPATVPGATHVYSLLPVLVRPDELGLTEAASPVLRDTLIGVMLAEGLWLDRWAPQPVGGELAVADLRAAPDATPPTSRFSEFPTVAAVADAAFGIGAGPSPLGGSSTPSVIDRIADCFEKVLVDHLDRLRQITRERATDVQLR